MKAYHLSYLRNLALGQSSGVCANCARQFHHLRPLLQATPSPSPSRSSRPSLPVPPPNKPTTSQGAGSSSPRTVRSSRFGQDPTLDPTTPGGHWQHPGYIEPLGRPIGHDTAPKLTDNSPLDPRDLSQKYKDFLSKDLNLQKRHEIKSAMARPYFRDWKNLRYEKGKLWLANEKLWRSEMSLWMPNLVGKTLDGQSYKTTTEVLMGKVSLVAIFQRDWAMKQCKTWFEEGSNPHVADMIKTGKLSLVNVNVEDAPLMKGIQNMFRWSMRRGMSPEEQGRYFFLNHIPGGVGGVKEEIGVLNSRVGYVYLVDENCKIRWAGCGDANEEEKDSLARSAERLIKQLHNAMPTRS